ncbi:subtilisin family serine protease [Saccharopolyspora erythraea NRRL 2338]|uniref:S8 family peptidase n=1 Tax=Saccharopolyspora erythraea TaxID=1836 RepID=UPI0003029A97|nr:S8 family peptidase [Saccharopolyspora erythraea]PFG97632.1 subtilisin family serine protease [Saccharopolyspora erythraea NRRL 2338]
MNRVRAGWRRRSVGIALSAVTGVVLAAATSLPAQAEGEIRNSDTGEIIPNSYLVVLSDTPQIQAADVSAVTANLLSRYTGELEHTFRTAVRGFSATMTDQQARRLAADPAVALVEPNKRVHAVDTQQNPPSWGLDRIDQRNLPLDNAYSYSTGADNVAAYVIDTGVRTTHQTFGGRAKHGFDAVDNDNDATDCNGHGTHVAGTIGGAEYGVAKGVDIYGVRVLDCQGSGSIAGVIAGIDWVTENAQKPAVANMSLGGGASSTLDQAVRNSVVSGVTYAVAAGNGDMFGNPQDACSSSPARTPEAITVGATDNTDTRASWSNYGTCLDIFAPGVGITSSWHSGDTATNTISGTSMATPHVAGAAALYLAANPSATPAQVGTALVAASTPNAVKDPRTGSPNRLLFTGTGDTPPPTGCEPVSSSAAVAIPDAGAAVTSSVNVTGCTGNARADLAVEVNITHTYRGDLVIDLISPSGRTWNLKQADVWDSADNVRATFTVDASSEVANGTWKLRVRDVYSQDTGRLDGWTLRA